VNLLADEGVDRAVVERLREDGHDVLYVAELAPSIPYKNKSVFVEIVKPERIVF
jgi:hypothetical protein